MFVEKNIRRDVSNVLVKRGYTRDGRMHSKRLTADFLYDIALFVGIRHDTLENLVSDLLGLPRDTMVASVGDNVGQILNGEYRTWDSGQRVEDVLSAIERAQERLLPYLTVSEQFKDFERRVKLHVKAADGQLP